MLPNKQEGTYNVLERISELCGITSDNINLEELSEIYEVLRILISCTDTDDYHNAVAGLSSIQRNLFLKYIIKATTNFNNRGRVEFMQEFFQILEVLFYKSGNVKSISFGMHWPSHIEVAGDLIENTNNPKTLLLGCLSPSSFREYFSFIKGLNETSSPYVIDLKGNLTLKSEYARNCFVIADALRLPFANEVLDIVFTSNLFKDIIDRDGLSGLVVLMLEVFRCLKSGGKISFIEYVPNDASEAEFLDELNIILASAGFSGIEFTESLEFSTRSTLYSSEGMENFSRNPDCIAISAEKPLEALKLIPYTS